MRHFFSFLLCAMCCTSVCIAQQKVGKRAQKFYNRALDYHAKRQDAKAEKYMAKALKKEPNYLDANAALGKWRMNAHRYAEAAAIYKTLANRDGKSVGQFQYNLAKSLLYSGKVQQALNAMPPFQDSLTNLLRQQANLQAKFLAQRDTSIARPIGSIWRINTSDAELFPSVSANGEKLYFTRRHKGDEDFYMALPDSCGGWLDARNMGVPPNSVQQESAQFISADGHYLFHMRCDGRSYSGWDGGGCDLYMAYTADSVWTIAQSFGGTINSAAYEGTPCLSVDNRELFFSSDRAGGYGGLDLWVAKFEEGLWQMPRNLGPSINTAGNETAPFLHPDGQSLFFSSTGHLGLGGSDIFISTRKLGDSIWVAPHNLGMPINSPFDEGSLSIASDGSTALFSSNRDSLAHNYSLYYAALPLSLKPKQITYVSGTTFDSVERVALNYANIYVADSLGNERFHIVSNRGDGSYMVALPVGSTYTTYTNRIGFKDKIDTLYCADSMAGKISTFNIALLPYDYVKPVRDSLLLTVNFIKNEAVLNSQLQEDILYALQPWLSVKDAKVKVNGYTDNTGTPMLNEQLSTLRARLVGSVIKQLSFLPNQIKEQGWGETAALVPNDTDEHRYQNRRVEVVVQW